MDVELLVDQCKKGDIESFMELISAKQEMLYKIAFTYTSNAYDAEDCLSEASIKAFNKIKQLRESDKFYKWYTSLLINYCRGRYRRQKKELDNLEKIYHKEMLEDISGDFAKAVEDQALVEIILESLKDDERDLLVLRFMEDFSIKEIAEIMGVAEGTVKSRLHRSLKKIRKRFGGIYK